MFIRSYLIPRLIQYLLVIFFGITAVFLIPRLLPNDPVMRTLAEMRGRGSFLEPGSMDKIIADMTQMYGLEGSWLDQYGAFWVRLAQGDLGVSFFQFPTPVVSLIVTALPWTVGLLLVTTILAWVIGNVLGAFAGYFTGNRWLQGLDAAAMVVRPMPYYIFSFALLLLFAYAVRWFPVSGGTSFGRQPGFNLPYIQDVLWHSFLPALSIVILGMAVWFQTMKLVVQSVVGESYVQYARLGGVTENKIVTRYVFRNALLPQITGLALSLGLIFSGALITEIVFSYPGLGTLLYNAIINGDYNLIMGITIFSIFAITTIVLIVDLLYPLFDPADQVFVGSIYFGVWTVLCAVQTPLILSTRSADSVKLFKDLLRDFRFRWGFWIMVMMVIFASLSFFSPYDPTLWGEVPRDERPSPEYWLGTDSNGQDIFWMATFAVRNSLTIALIAGLVSRVIAVTVGMVAGYLGGKSDRALMFVSDSLLVIPLFLMIVLLAMLIRDSMSLISLGLLLAIFGWAWDARLIRSQILSLREREFTKTAVLSGTGTMRLVLNEYMPYSTPLIFSTLINNMAWAIGLEITLAILGLLDLSIPTLGTMLYWAINYQAVLLGRWWWVLTPIVLSILIFISLYWLSVSISEYLDPRRRIQRVGAG